MKKVIVVLVFFALVLMLGVPRLVGLQSFLYTQPQSSISGLPVHEFSYNSAERWEIELPGRIKAYSILDASNYENLTRRNDIVQYFVKNLVWKEDRFERRKKDRSSPHFLDGFSDFNIKDGQHLFGFNLKTKAPQLIHDFKDSVSAEALTSLTSQIALPIDFSVNRQTMLVVKNKGSQASAAVLLIKTRKDTALYIFELQPQSNENLEIQSTKPE